MFFLSIDPVLRALFGFYKLISSKILKVKSTFNILDAEYWDIDLDKSIGQLKEQVEEHRLLQRLTDFKNKIDT